MTHEQPETISSIVITTRTDRQMTMQDLAAALGVSQQAIDLWEKGRSAPGYDRIMEWLREGQPAWVHEFGAHVARVKYAELLTHIRFTLCHP